MKFDDMQKGRFDDPQVEPQISNGNLPAASQPAEPRKPHTPPYSKNEFTIQNLEEPVIYNKRVLEYAREFNIRIAPTLQLALEHRMQGQVTMTLRELDIAARIKVPLDKDFVYKALRAFAGMFTEGIPGQFMEGKIAEKDNVYFLRSLYNRGIKFKTKGSDGKSDYDRSTPQKQADADQLLRTILDKLKAQQLPAWPEEVEKGFPTELCKPEYMTWYQFNKAQAVTVRAYSTGEQQYEYDSSPITGTIIGPDARYIESERAEHDRQIGISGEDGNANSPSSPGMETTHQG